MNKIVNKITLLISSVLLLGACSSNVILSSNNQTTPNSSFSSSNNQTSSMSFSNNNGQTITTKEKFTNYSNFQRIDSNTKLVYEEGFDHILESYEEAMAYKALLEEKSETIIDKDSGASINTYSDMINFLSSLSELNFETNVLYISKEDMEMNYNKDSCRLEGMYIKDKTIYVHLYRDYLYKSLGIVVHQSYAFFVNKEVTFNNVEFDIEDLF